MATTNSQRVEVTQPKKWLELVTILSDPLTRDASTRSIARYIGLSRKTVYRYRKRIGKQAAPAAPGIRIYDAEATR